MDYKVLSDETLFNILVENMQALSGAVDVLIGPDSPFPDPRDIARVIKGMSAKDYIENMTEFRDEVVKNMDLQEMIAEITRETVDLQKELLRRY